MIWGLIRDHCSSKLAFSADFRRIIKNESLLFILISPQRNSETTVFKNKSNLSKLFIVPHRLNVLGMILFSTAVFPHRPKYRSTPSKPAPTRKVPDSAPVPGTARPVSTSIGPSKIPASSKATGEKIALETPLASGFQRFEPESRLSRATMGNLGVPFPRVTDARTAPAEVRPCAFANCICNFARPRRTKFNSRGRDDNAVTRFRTSPASIRINSPLGFIPNIARQIWAHLFLRKLTKISGDV